jgi:hypothetical protein
MAESSVFGGAIEFLDRLGVYDVVLPFLLVFTIVFAILDKTRILGVDKIENKEYTKKNLNAIIAFVISFLVVASTTLVRVINEVVANIVLLMVLVISFIMLVGVFHGTGEATLKDHPGWAKFFMAVVFIVIIMIFLQALGWLQLLINFITLTDDFDWVATLVLLVIVIAFMLFITAGRNGAHDSKEHKEHK